jgi:hypothetical protein
MSPSKESNGSTKGIESLAILPQLNSYGDVQKQGLLLMNGTKKNFRIPFVNEIDNAPPSPKRSPRKSISEEAQYDEKKYESKGFSTRDPVFDFLKFKNYPVQDVYTTKEVVIEFEKEASELKETSPSGLTVITKDPTVCDSARTPRSPRSPKTPRSPTGSSSPKSPSAFTPRSPSTPRDSSNSPRALPSREKVHSSGLIVGDDFIKNVWAIQHH